MSEARERRLHWSAGFGYGWRSELGMPHLCPLPAGMSLLGASLRGEIHINRVEQARERTFTRLPAGARVSLAEDGFRYAAGDDVLMDAYGMGLDVPARIEVSAGAGWTGELPAATFSTVAGLLLAMRGTLPLHGSAVELDGRAHLVCGASGAGKSTLTAGLIALGARLVSDDLTVLYPAPAGGVPVVFAGRRTIRLFRDVVGFLESKVALLDEPFLSLGKLAVAPPQVPPTVPLPLASVVLLGGDSHAVAESSERAGLLSRQFFRPAWMARLPGHRRRVAELALATRGVKVLRAPPVEARNADAFRDQAQRIADRLRQQA